MKRIYFILGIGLLTLIGCSNGPSLQKYFVSKQDNENFLSLDVPTSIVSLKEGASKENLETLKSIKKVNLLMFKLTQENRDVFEEEKSEVMAVLKNKNLIELMRANHEGTQLRVVYVGDEDTVDEFIVFAANDQEGFGLARVLGDRMEPHKIMALLNDFDRMDKENPIFSQIEGFMR
ncbi:DUF4252 domain-containing protein [Namhaeicola litoreus]|uniref:DUF4252 domain-containing protein n=1 Tax=Namhaeicola litoreus TaxID=1052145 RepID=A0ABW3Y5L8_9FLAO